MSDALTVEREGADHDALLLSAQLDLLVGVTSGEPLGLALDALLRVVEQVSRDGLLASVLLLDDSGRHLRHCSAPSLPAAYNEAIDGIEIGPSVGSCGTAAFLRRQVIVTDIDTDPLWADFRALALDAGLRACWSTPIVGSRGTLLGTFAMYYPAPASPTPSDLVLIAVLVRSVAAAIERSRLDAEREQDLARERHLGLTFQRSLLPIIPQAIHDVALVSRYRTGDPGVHVGGDWFDAVAVGGDLVLVVGDVQGHDADAAALMGQLRTVVRVAAMESHPPAVVLTQAADYLDRLAVERLTTVLVVHLDVDSGLATAASAGHLAPLVVKRAHGGHRVTELDIDVGPPLGAGTGWEERTTQLEPGDLVVMYTDGLIETRNWDIDEGISRLRATLTDLAAGASPAQVLERSLQLVPPGQRGDDVAVLAAAIPGRTTSVERIERSLPAQSLSVPLARRWAHGWLSGSTVPESAWDVVLLVISELVTNAVRQEKTPSRITLTVEGPSLLVEVYDSGHRTPVRVLAAPESTGGRGLAMVEAVCEDWGVREQSVGKVVWARVAW